jgi:hypothetical protein
VALLLDLPCGREADEARAELAARLEHLRARARAGRLGGGWAARAANRAPTPNPATTTNPAHLADLRVREALDLGEDLARLLEERLAGVEARVARLLDVACGARARGGEAGVSGGWCQRAGEGRQATGGCCGGHAHLC